MIRLIPLMLAAALFVFSGCKKSEPPRSEPLVDTAMVLPEVPELEPLEEVYPEPEPEPVSKPVKKTDPSRGIVKDGAYTLQVGIYNTERQAQKRAESLKNQGFPAYVTKVQDPTPALSGTYYRVRIGSFASSTAARAYGAANLAPEGIEYWADLKGRDTQPVKQVFKPQALTPKPAPAPAPAITAPPAVEPASAQPVEDTQSAPTLPDW